MSSLVVIAKECVPGRVKTRLHPAMSFEDAAAVAAASLADTLAAVREVRCARRILFFDGEPPAGFEDFEVVLQRTGPLDERLGDLFDRMTERTLLIGMDTPQVDPEVLSAALADDSGMDAWFGPASDGGFWALGLDRPRGSLVRGVPMSRDDTGARQLRRLTAARLAVGMLPTLTDVDTIHSARQVAAEAQDTRFAAALRNIDAARSSSGEAVA